ncbi:hypothetical protein [Flexivirga oryzae]|uniref:Uncharacterized protein n=1 Tax=Flexivirga oryzae TaxID=1794944 RepID=A0A839NCR1_9MICO|nr:hypothetical protein [Flexivirga oryzae]MBB2892491.1 hypothetical protein [Flexivirga oryzae]
MPPPTDSHPEHTLMTIIWDHNLSQRDQELQRHQQDKQDREKRRHEPGTDTNTNTNTDHQPGTDPTPDDWTSDDWTSDDWETDDGDEDTLDAFDEVGGEDLPDGDGDPGRPETDE